tara:strand:+ start:848 stop:1012 length:165 start_codon:yes stop_codon:yes gene_type:complete
MLGQIFKLYRSTYQLNQTQLAVAIGVSKSSIINLEIGKKIQAHTLAKIMMWLTK